MDMKGKRKSDYWKKACVGAKATYKEVPKIL